MLIKVVGLESPNPPWWGIRFAPSVPQGWFGGGSEAVRRRVGSGSGAVRERYRRNSGSAHHGGIPQSAMGPVPTVRPGNGDTIKGQVRT